MGSEMCIRDRYVTMWQNCIRPCGNVQLKSLVLTMRSDFNTGGVCKVVGTHRVLHLGSIERERVTREWASDVPCGYYGMIYLGGVYILGVHMGHKLILFFLACIA